MGGEEKSCYLNLHNVFIILHLHFTFAMLCFPIGTFRIIIFRCLFLFLFICQHIASVPMLINSTAIFTAISQFSDNDKSLLSNELR